MLFLVGILHQLNQIRDFERENLPFLKTVEDFDIVRAIGLKQERGEMLLLKQLFLEGIGSITTVARRVTRLRNESVILAVPTDNDRRMVGLLVSPNIQKIFVRYGALLEAI